jgi:hypothetical protein
MNFSFSKTLHATHVTMHRLEYRKVSIVKHRPELKNFSAVPFWNPAATRAVHTADYISALRLLLVADGRLLSAGFAKC